MHTFRRILASGFRYYILPCIHLGASILWLMKSANLENRTSTPVTHKYSAQLGVMLPWKKCVCGLLKQNETVTSLLQPKALAFTVDSYFMTLNKCIWLLDTCMTRCICPAGPYECQLNVEAVKRNMSSVNAVCVAFLCVRPMSFCPLAPVSSSSPVSKPSRPVWSGY